MKVTACLGFLCVLTLMAVVPSMDSAADVTVQENQHQPRIPTAYAQSDAMEPTQHSSPLQQYNDGTSLHEIRCNEPKDLYITGSDMPVCLYQDTYEILLSRGVSLSLPPTPESIVRGTVNDAIALYESNPDGAFADIDAMESMKAEYPFVLDADGYIVAHGANPALVGEFATSVITSLVTSDRSLDIVISELQEGEVWTEYVFYNPAAGTDQHKNALLVLHDGYIFGSGYYTPPEAIVRGTVNDAIALYESNPDGAFADIDAMESMKAEYPFVLDADGYIVAHGANPALVGELATDLVTFDRSLDVILSEIQEGEVWTEYVFYNPAAGTDQHKNALLVLHDGYIFGSGYYTPLGDSMTDAASALDLTAEEKQWLEENGTIRVTYNSGWAPIEYSDESGNFAGVTFEYAKEFSKQTGAEFVGTQSATIWSNVVEMIRDGNADVMFSVISLPERLEYMDFTSTHYSIETRIVAVDDRQISMDEPNLKILTIQGYDIASWLDENHPDLEYAVADSFGDAFAMLSAGDADALVSTWPVASYHAAQAGIDSIYDAGPTGYQYDLKVGYSNQNPILGSILQKVVDNIPSSQIEQWYADAAPQ